MNSQRRTWMARVGVVAVVAAGALIGIAAPALADPTQINNAASDQSVIAPGDTVSVGFTLTKPTAPDQETIANFRVSSDNPNLTCTNGCSGNNISFNGGESEKNFTAKLKAKSGLQGQGDIQANITIEAAGAQPVQLQVTIQVPEAPPSVPSVSGRVENVLDATPVPNAKVYMQDSANHQFGPIGTDNKGNFKFTSTQAKPIAPGVIAILVQKDGWEDGKNDFTGDAGVPLSNVRVKMKNLASASASAPPTSDAAQETTDAAASGEATNPLAGNSDQGGFSWWLIIVGGLLVAVGVGAIVLLLLRRRGDDDAPDDDPTAMGGPRGRPGAPPARAGGPRGPQRQAPPTAVMRRPEPVGARGADPTMITRSPLADRPRQPAGPPMDNPTMVHGRVGNDMTDPYGNRQGPGQPPAGGYGAPSGPGGGYPTQAGGSYDGGYGGGYGGQGGAPAYPTPGSPTAYPAPSSSAHYPPPSPAGGYPPPTSPAGYPTGEYNPGYGQQAQGGYQSPSYGDPYGAPAQPPAHSGGYGADNYGGYGQTGGAAGSYGGQPGGYGSDQPTGGYDAYGSQGNRGQEPQGYDEYDQRQSRHGQRPNPPQAGERRLDWLDD